MGSIQHTAAIPPFPIRCGQSILPYSRSACGRCYTFGAALPALFFLIDQVQFYGDLCGS
jgi:hypothetical protein